MIHKLFYAKGRRLHGQDFRNVQAACTHIIKQAQPVQDSQVQRNDANICRACDRLEIPAGFSAIFLREAQENEAPAQQGLRAAA